MKYCSTCGAQIPADAKVCPVCGTALNPAAAAPTTSAATYNFNIPSLICAAIALLLFFVAPFTENVYTKVTHFENMKQLLSHLDIVMENFSLNLGDLIFTFGTAVCIILCLVYSFTNNKGGAIKAAITGIVLTFIGFFVSVMMLGMEFDIPFGDIISGYFNALGEMAWGFWLIPVSFVGVIVSNKKAN